MSFVLESISTGRRYQLPEGVSCLGRHADSVAPITSDAIALLHASVSVRGDSCFVCDNHSTGGVYVNGVRIPAQAEVRLRYGDSFSLAYVEGFRILEQPDSTYECHEPTEGLCLLPSVLHPRQIGYGEVLQGRYKVFGALRSRSDKMVHLGSQRLETEKLVLRCGDMLDVEPMRHSWAWDSPVSDACRMLPTAGGAEGYIRYRLASYWRADFYDWFIELKETGEVIGSISLTCFPEEDASYEINYIIGRKWRCQDVIAEVFAEVTRFAFEEVGVQRLAVLHDVGDFGGSRALRRCGMESVGAELDGAVPRDGQDNRSADDLRWFSITAKEYRARHL